MKIIILLILLSTLANAENTFRILIDVRACPSCSLMGLSDIINNLETKYPTIKRNALVVSDDIRELKPLQNEFKNIDFYCDSNGVIKDKYKITSKFALILIDENSNILYKSLDILHNSVDYKQIDSIINEKQVVVLKEGDDNILLTASNGSVNKDGTKICILNDFNMRINIFNTISGNLIKNIQVSLDSIQYKFKNNFSQEDWQELYKEKGIGSSAVKILNCFFDENENIILTGFCLSGVKKDTVVEMYKGEEATLYRRNYQAKNFYVKIKEDKVIIDSLNDSDFAEIKTKYFLNDVLISNVLPVKYKPNNFDSTFLFKFTKLSNKDEILYISLKQLKDNNIPFRDSVGYTFLPFNIYNFKDNVLLNFNSYLNIAFAKVNDNFIKIEPEATLKEIFAKDTKYSTESYLDSYRTQSFNGYVVLSTTFGEGNTFFVVLYNSRKDIITDIVIQKYDIYKGFIKETKIESTILKDEIKAVSHITFNSNKILLKLKNHRWIIFDYTKYFE